MLNFDVSVLRSRFSLVSDWLLVEGNTPSGKSCLTPQMFVMLVYDALHP